MNDISYIYYIYVNGIITIKYNELKNQYLILTLLITVTAIS